MALTRCERKKALLENSAFGRAERAQASAVGLASVNNMLLREESGEGSAKNNSKLQRNMVFSSPPDFFLLCDGVGVARQALEQGFV